MQQSTFMHQGHLGGQGAMQNVAAMRRLAPKPAFEQTNLEKRQDAKQQSKTLARNLIWVAGGLLIFSLLLYGLASNFGVGIARSGHSASEEPKEIVIGNSVLMVPQNIIRFPKQRKASTQTRLELYLHWPSLSGYSDERAHVFSQAGDTSDLIFISIERRSMSLDMSGRISPIYSKFFDPAPVIAEYGLLRKGLSAEGGFVDEDLYFQDNSEYPFAARCVRENSAVGNPLCLRDVHLGHDLMLTYRFHKKHLHSWLDIDERIRNHMFGLLVKPVAKASAS